MSTTDSAPSFVASVLSVGFLATAAAGLYYLGTKNPDWRTAEEIRKRQEDGDTTARAKHPRRNGAESSDDSDDGWYGAPSEPNRPILPSEGGSSGALFNSSDCSALHGTCAHGCDPHETLGGIAVIRTTDSNNNSRSIVINNTHNITYNVQVDPLNSNSANNTAGLKSNLYGTGPGSCQPTSLLGDTRRSNFKPFNSYDDGTYDLSDDDGTTDSYAVRSQKKRLLAEPFHAQGYGSRQARYDSDDESGSEFDYEPDNIRSPTTSPAILRIGLGPKDSTATQTAGALVPYGQPKKPKRSLRSRLHLGGQSSR